MSRIAFIIGNSEYDNFETYPNLDYVDIDLKNINKTFESYGSFDQIKLLHNSLSHEVKGILEETLSELTHKNEIFIYFSGHGDIIDDKLYLVGKNTKKSQIRTTSIEADFIVECLKSSRAQSKSLILDCCFSGAFSNSFTKSSKDIVPNYQLVNAKGVYIITSSRASQTSGKGEEYSLFTEYLVKGIETHEADYDKDGFVTLDELYRYIYLKMESSKQIPKRFYDGEGNVYIARYKKDVLDLSNNIHLNIKNKNTKLISKIENIQSYLESFIQEYNEKEISLRYIELRVVNSNLFDGTIFKAEIGRYSYIRNSKELTCDLNKLNYWILTKQEISKLVELGCAKLEANNGCAKINWECLLQKAESIKEFEKRISIEQQQVYEAAFQNLKKNIIEARRQYAEYILNRLGYDENQEILSLLMKKPPFFPKKLQKIISPKTLPLNASSMWKYYFRKSFEIKGIPAPKYVQPIEMTDNLKSLLKEDKDNDIFLIPMESVESSFNSFIQSTNINLYVLLADFGAGKTTVLQHFMFKLAQKKLNAWDDSLVRVPILLNLRDYNEVLDFDKLIKSFLINEIGLEEQSFPIFRKLNSDGCFILLLDGFDEMLERVTKHERRK